MLILTIFLSTIWFGSYNDGVYEYILKMNNLLPFMFFYISVMCFFYLLTVLLYIVENLTHIGVTIKEAEMWFEKGYKEFPISGRINSSEKIILTKKNVRSIKLCMINSRI